MSFDPRIDFLGRRRWPAAGLGLAALALAAVAWQGGLALREFDWLQQQRTGLASLQRQARTQQLPAMSAEDSQRHVLVEALARYIATPWERLLALFEEHAATHVILTRFQPEAAQGRVEISGRAPGQQALAAYIVALERDPRLSAVMLHHHEVLRSASGAPVEFTLGATWGDALRAAPSNAAPASMPTGSTR